MTRQNVAFALGLLGSVVCAATTVWWIVARPELRSVSSAQVPMFLIAAGFGAPERASFYDHLLPRLASGAMIVCVIAAVAVVLRALTRLHSLHNLANLVIALSAIAATMVYFWVILPYSDLITLRPADQSYWLRPTADAIAYYSGLAGLITLVAFFRRYPKLISTDLLMRVAKAMQLREFRRQRRVQRWQRLLRRSAPEKCQTRREQLAIADRYARRSVWQFEAIDSSRMYLWATGFACVFTVKDYLYSASWMGMRESLKPIPEMLSGFCFMAGMLWILVGGVYAVTYLQLQMARGDSSVRRSLYWMSCRSSDLI